jgi:hypothetical protein
MCLEAWQSSRLETAGAEPMNIYAFTSSGEAYDCSQWSSLIKDGDLLIVPSEQIAGFLMQAWPCAVTPNLGAFHALAEGSSWENMEDGKYLISAMNAQRIAAEGFKVALTSVEDLWNAELAHCNAILAAERS